MADILHPMLSASCNADVDYVTACSVCASTGLALLDSSVNYESVTFTKESVLEHALYLGSLMKYEYLLTAVSTWPIYTYNMYLQYLLAAVRTWTICTHSICTYSTYSQLYVLETICTYNIYGAVPTHSCTC